MRKYHESAPENASRPRRSKLPAAVLLGLALLVSPLLFEGGKVVLANWVSMTGAYRTPETPLLDAIGGWSRDADVVARRYWSGLFNGGSWRASTAVPLAVTWALLMGVVFLRRVR